MYDELRKQGTSAPRSAATVFRRIVAALILVPLAVVIIAFAVANRQDVTVSLDPFNSDIPAASTTWPLFVVIIAVLILGVLIGGIAVWLRQTKWRWTARRLERELADLRGELEQFRRTAATPVAIPEAVAPPERLQLRPPMH